MPHNLKSAFTRLLPPIKVESAIIARNRLFGPAMDANRFVFVIEIPPKFEQDVIANRRPSVQINADATGIAQAGNGVAYLQQIIAQQVLSFARHAGGTSSLPVNFMEHVLFNPNLRSDWFTSVMQVINNITMLSVMLTGAALIREREHGTIEHLLAIPDAERDYAC